MTNNSAAQFTSDILGFDIGSARIGVARIHPIVKLSEPLAPIVTKFENSFDSITEIIKTYHPSALVFGLPRSLNGNETEQTRSVREFVEAFIREVKPSLPLYFIDEAGTSKAADERLQGDTKISRDSMSACIMIEDFVQLKDITQLEIK